MIEPTIIELPIATQDFGRHRTGKYQTFKAKNYACLSLLKQMERKLNFVDVEAEVLKPKLSEPGRLTRFNDGLAFQNNALFKQCVDALQVILYLDEVQMCAELGSRTKNNKQVFVYCSLGNLEQKFRSSHRSILLLAIFPNIVMQRFGLNTLLRPIVDELKKLENGVLMDRGGKSTMVRGTLSAVVADNLASH